MTLKEKFENVLHNWIDKDYNRQHVANELEIDSDEFAIEFAEWLQENNGAMSYQELLKEFKKEKGL